MDITADNVQEVESALASYYEALARASWEYIPEEDRLDIIEHSKPTRPTGCYFRVHFSGEELQLLVNVAHQCGSQVSEVIRLHTLAGIKQHK